MAIQSKQEVHLREARPVSINARDTQAATDPRWQFSFQRADGLAVVIIVDMRTGQITGMRPDTGLLFFTLLEVASIIGQIRANGPS